LYQQKQQKMNFYEFWLTKLNYTDLMAERANLEFLMETTENENVKRIVNKKYDSLIKRIEIIERLDKLENEMV
jgi:hypothetical protein